MPDHEQRLDGLTRRAARGDFRERPGLIPFLMAGDGGFEVSLAAIFGLEQAGAVALELGVAHSDPIADGPVLQAASRRVLERGFSFAASCDLIRAYRAAGGALPIITFGYANVLLAARGEAGLEQLARAGSDALAICDLPPEEGREHAQACARHGLRSVCFVGPTSSPERVRLADRCATGFVYAVARRGTTGRSTPFEEEQLAYLERVRSQCERALAVGFGISSREQIELLNGRADFAVIGSALVAHLNESRTDARRAAREFLRGLRQEETTT